MEKQKILDSLKEYKKEDVERFASYLIKLSRDEKSAFINKYSEEALCELFRRVENEWLHFDGIHITLLSTGVFYDYVALKNKMLIVYPETVFDVNIVYKWDTFSFEKNSWKVTYSHKFSNPFGNKEDDIIGAYAIVKNKRGEYITLLSADDLEKHRKTAKTDFIWRAWYTEMCMKTIVKKACKIHFGDIYTNIEEMDNENYDASRVITPVSAWGEKIKYNITNEKWLTFDDYIASIDMERDVSHITTLYNECKSTFNMSIEQWEWLESVKEWRIQKLTDPAKSNRMPTYS